MRWTRTAAFTPVADARAVPQAVEERAEGHLSEPRAWRQHGDRRVLGGGHHRANTHLPTSLFPTIPEGPHVSNDEFVWALELFQ